ncbi:RDD family protein [Hoyosella altamirensis]|uniref:Putative RDD family membrane protein YckC n=1 Tax=Hoyosella altamirensis TaxID=616997 RepID=A0A839RKV7_9ACTN|nr:RDD family protein [Hoyosella altamirensis]MBB3036621.1 putative RDD family membrane protein YckC [Hoyosella altamirensis]
MATAGGMRNYGIVLEPAGLKVRFAARVIDCVFSLALGAATYLVLSLAGVPDVVAATPAALFAFLYFVIFEVTTGSTPGKRLFGLLVEGTGSEFRPTLIEATIRNAFMLLGLIPVIGIVLWLSAAIVIAVTVSANAHKQGLHDQLANGTQVLRAS